MASETRKCWDCEIEKPLTREYFHRDGKRLKTRCKDCINKEQNIKRGYTWTKSEVELSILASDRYIAELEKGFGTYQRRINA
jgi:hypothetical protein